MSDQPPASRRDFTAGVSGALGAAAHEAVVSEVEIKTRSGTCDASLVRPGSQGRWPGAILFADAFGLRRTMVDMAKRLARDGYTVLVPNPYYRSTKAPAIAPGFSFSNPADRDKLKALRDPLTAEAVSEDSMAYMAFLDAHPSVKTIAKMGVFGYCMGGPMSMRAAATVPERVGAGASLHGGGLVTGKPDSPHLLVPKMKTQYYFGVAANDDAQEPESKSVLRKAFDSAGLRAKIEVYEGCMHGWCVKDMPNAPDGKPIYNEAQAERAWNELLALFKQALV